MIPEVPKLWPGSTVVCIASGPSLTQEDCDYVRGKARVIVVNRSVELAPWADVLYCADARMWKWLHDDGALEGVTLLRYGLERWPDVAKYGVTVLRNTGGLGFEHSPSGLRTGGNSGHQAINLAVHLGASRILLLGFDGKAGEKGRQEWHEPHPSQSKPANYPRWTNALETMVEPLKQAGVTVINCSRESAHVCFPRMALREALPETCEVAA